MRTSRMLVVLVLGCTWAPVVADDATNKAAVGPAKVEEAALHAGDSVIVSEDGAEVRSGEKVLGKLSKGAKGTIEKVQGSWALTKATEDGRAIRGWILMRQLRRVSSGLDDKETQPTVVRLNTPAQVLYASEPGLFWSIDAEIGLANRNGEVQIPSGTPWSIRPIPQSDGSLESLAAESSTQPIAGISLKEALVTDAGLAHLKDIAGLKYLRVVECGEITNAGLAEISRVPDLEVLELYYCRQVTDEGLAALSGHKKLSRVLLGGPPQSITKVGIEALTKLPSLETLFLVHLDAANDDALRILGNIKGLRSLTLLGCKQFRGPGLADLANTELRVLTLWYAELESNGLEGLRRLPDLQYLDLMSTDLSAVDSSPLSTLRKLLFLKLTSTNANDATLVHLKDLNELKGLLVWGCFEVSDAGAAHLKGLTKLEKLQLYGKITEAGVASLTNLTAIKDLTLPDKALTDNSLQALKTLTHMETLSIGNEVTDKGLALLADKAALSNLTISGGKVTDEGLMHLSKLANLKELTLWNTTIQGRGFSHLATLPHLMHLKLHSGKVKGGLSALSHLKTLRIKVDDTDAALRGVERLSLLEELDLSGSNVTVEGLRTISAMVNLRKLNLSDCDDLGTDALDTISQLRGLEELAMQWNDSMADKSLSSLASLERLVHLKLGGSLVKNERPLGTGLVHLKNLKSLRKLDLFAAPLNEEAYSSPMQLPSLNSIDLRRYGGLRQSWETDEKRNALQDALPHTRIEW